MRDAAHLPPLTVDEFLAWSDQQEQGRHELFSGEIFAMSPERVGHNEAKQLTWLALREAVSRRGLNCQVFGDGLTVPVDETSSFEPDALVRCGDRLDPDTVKVTDPVIVVEVISPRTSKIDSGLKLGRYFQLTSVVHYLVIDGGRPTLTHHCREASGEVRTTFHLGGKLLLDPPGIEIDVAVCFPPAYPSRSEPG